LQHYKNLIPKLTPLAVKEQVAHNVEEQVLLLVQLWTKEQVPPISASCKVPYITIHVANATDGISSLLYLSITCHLAN
jgi:hypothetical protein